MGLQKTYKRSKDLSVGFVHLRTEKNDYLIAEDRISKLFRLHRLLVEPGTCFYFEPNVVLDYSSLRPLNMIYSPETQIQAVLQKWFLILNKTIGVKSRSQVLQSWQYTPNY